VWAPAYQFLKPAPAAIRNEATATSPMANRLNLVKVSPLESVPHLIGRQRSVL
jgi:hypothetical protein